MENEANNFLPYFKIYLLNQVIHLKKKIVRKPVKIDSIIPVTASTTWDSKHFLCI